MNIKAWTAVAAVAAGIGLFIWWPQTGPEQAVAASTESAPTSTSAVGDVQSMDPQELEQHQRAANQAVIQELGARPFEGPIEERPPFVSLIEWQVLNQVAQQSPEPEQELTRLVNHLRFAKQWDLWKDTAQTRDSDQRQALGEQLLEEIPQRVSNRELDAAYAQQMQLSLLTELISDESERRRRAAQEAARIGVTFDLERTVQ